MVAEVAVRRILEWGSWFSCREGVEEGAGEVVVVVVVPCYCLWEVAAVAEGVVAEVAEVGHLCHLQPMLVLQAAGTVHRPDFHRERAEAFLSRACAC